MTLEEKTPLARETTLRAGGRAEYFSRVKNQKDLQESLSFAVSNKLPFFVLGGGSNVLFKDGGYKGVVIKNELLGIEFNEKRDFTEVVAGAGENWDYLVSLAVDKGLWGLENLSGIPGTVGGTPVQNVGAYGEEVKNTILWVEAYDFNSGKIRLLKNRDCAFGYRDSFFKTEKGRKLVITRVCFKLKNKGKPNLLYKDLVERFVGRNNADISPKDMREAVIQIRSSKFPDLSKVGTVGSFFKNPVLTKKKFSELSKKFPELPNFPAGRGKVKISLAWILDKVCGLKGYKKEDVGLFENQPLVLVNYGGATSEEIISFADEIAEAVKNKTGIAVEREISLVP